MATRTSITAGGWGTSRSGRLAGAMAGLAGALAIAGALLPWVSVDHGKRSALVRGTSFSLGTLTLVAGIALVVLAVASILVASGRIRAALAIAIIAVGAVILIGVGAGLATKSFLNQAADQGKHQRADRSGKGGSAASSAQIPGAGGYAVGAALPPRVGQASSVVLAAEPMAAKSPKAKGKKNRKAVTSSLQAGVFIGLGGGLLGLIAGIWLLMLAPSSRRRQDTTGPAWPAAPPPGSSYGAPFLPVQARRDPVQIEPVQQEPAEPYGPTRPLPSGAPSSGSLQEPASDQIAQGTEQMRPVIEEH